MKKSCFFSKHLSFRQILVYFLAFIVTGMFIYPYAMVSSVDNNPQHTFPWVFYWEQPVLSYDTTDPYCPAFQVFSIPGQKNYFPFYNEQKHFWALWTVDQLANLDQYWISLGSGSSEISTQLHLDNIMDKGVSPLSKFFFFFHATTI